MSKQNVNLLKKEKSIRLYIRLASVVIRFSIIWSIIIALVVNIVKHILT